MSRVYEPPLDAVRDAVARALAEDLLPLGDLTSRMLPPEATATAQFVARDAGVLAGRLCADETFRQVDPEVDVQWRLSDGDAIGPGDVIGEVSGRLTTVLTGERTALNFMCHLSGIATLVREYVDEAATGGTAKVWDTRKTIPGLRSLAKAAVRAGGGRNHRGNLSEWLMFKDNHLMGMTISEAVEQAHDQWPGRTIEVEADRLDQVEEATRAGAEAILLDNMTPDQVREAVALVESIIGEGRRPLLEASGGIRLDTIASYAGTGVDMISVSRLTQSAPALDIGLDIH
ncbi:MAG: carboxylating nicotinate-nucleotide diphosphorylase [Actinomycetota bacterium]